MTDHLPSKDPLSQALSDLDGLVEFAYEQGFHEMGYSPEKVVADEIHRLQCENDSLARDCNDKDITIERLRAALTGISTCSTCEACRGAALRALGGETSLDAKIGALLIGRGFYDRLKDQTDEDTAARIVYEFLQAAKPIVSQHYGRTPPPGDGPQ